MNETLEKLATGELVYDPQYDEFGMTMRKMEDGDCVVRFRAESRRFGLLSAESIKKIREDLEFNRKQKENEKLRYIPRYDKVTTVRGKGTTDLGEKMLLDDKYVDFKGCVEDDPDEKEDFRVKMFN